MGICLDSQIHLVDGSALQVSFCERESLLGQIFRRKESLVLFRVWDGFDIEGLAEDLAWELIFYLFCARDPNVGAGYFLNLRANPSNSVLDP